MEAGYDIGGALEERSYLNGHSPPEEHKVLTIGDRIIGTLQNIVVFSGLPKAGKSTFLNGCIASGYTQFPIFSMSILTPKGRKKICYIDTESGEYDFYRSIGRVKSILQLSDMPPTFSAYRFRDCNPSDIQQYTEYYLEHNKDCSVLFIDGFLDLLMNYNDEVESRRLINWLKKITGQYNILLIGVVHTGKKDGMTLGHFGSMIDRYCQSVLTVEKSEKDQTFELKAKFLRSDIAFEPIRIVNEMGYFRQIN